MPFCTCIDHSQYNWYEHDSAEYSQEPEYGTPSKSPGKDTTKNWSNYNRSTTIQQHFVRKPVCKLTGSAECSGELENPEELPSFVRGRDVGNHSSAESDGGSSSCCLRLSAIIRIPK